MMGFKAFHSASTTLAGIEIAQPVGLPSGVEDEVDAVFPVFREILVDPIIGTDETAPDRS